MTADEECRQVVVRKERAINLFGHWYINVLYLKNIFYMIYRIT